ncbi:DNA-binding CsgD family transcriptional regulator/PAS domain-containing protein [Bosea sp. OAE752]|jgi:DNA-binding CsgD family transcriptional regulator/PAS domain-containing protein|uniref:PAS domain-containing protein n=1 Tax=unclassified Bosea (in: a-proteobacteria) TaxID=2653178 RepID=UPI00056EA2E1|nr:PAS domain-containing protein [Bosea sp. UNC402CLCol]
MPAPNLDTVMSAVDQLLSGAMDEEQMPAAAETLRQLFNGSKACFASVGPNPEDWVAYATNVDEALQARCFGDLAQDFVEMGFALRNIPLGQVYHDHEVYGRERLHSSRIWQEWMQPQDMHGGMACRLAENGEAFWFFDVQRGRHQEGFDREDVALLGKLYPVLRRIAEVRRHLGRVAIQRDEARGALDSLAMGIVIVDQDLRIIYANEGADEILAEPDGALSLRQGRVFARQPSDHRQFRQLVEAAAHGGRDPLGQQRSSLILRGDDRAHSLSACVMPAALSLAPAGSHSKVMIALRRLEMATDIVACSRQLFDLTETEAKFASALASGLSLTEAAAAQRVRISTARTHLARIFQKTDTRQQSQLVSLLRSADLPLRSR